MNRFADACRRFIDDEDGAGAAEYAIVVAFISAAITAAVSQFDLQTIFQTVSTRVIGWTNSSPAP